MDPHVLSPAEARRIAVRAQRLDDDRPDTLTELVHDLTLLQRDQTRAVAPSADLVAWSRLGLGYAPHHLTDALAAGTVVEFRGNVRPAADIALYRPEMTRWHTVATAPRWGRGRVEWVEANAAYRTEVLARLADEGPLTPRQLPDTCEVPWRSSGWNAGRNAVMMLDCLELRGEAATTGATRGRDRLWDLAERVFPGGDEPVAIAADDARRERHARHLRAAGIARATGPASETDDADLRHAGEPAVIEGVRGRWRVDPGQLGRPFLGRVALLSPLDRLVFDRARMADLFGFDYQLEMYKPKAKRRFGYWALPVLASDALVGKVDATADRARGVLRVDAVHRDGHPGRGEWDEPTETAVDAEIVALAEWLDLEPVRPPA